MDNVFKTLAHVQKQRDIDTVSNAAMLLANHNSGHLLTILKGILHLFFSEIGSFYNSLELNSWVYSFRIHSADFLIFGRISQYQ